MIEKLIRSLKDGDGFTLKNFRTVTYKTGYQVATRGVDTKVVDEVATIICNFNGDCGVWLEDGVYYIDKSIRIQSKAAALEVGEACEQISIYGWKEKTLFYCNRKPR